VWGSSRFPHRSRAILPSQGTSRKARLHPNTIQDHPNTIQDQTESLGSQWAGNLPLCCSALSAASSPSSMRATSVRPACYHNSSCRKTVPFTFHSISSTVLSSPLPTWSNKLSRSSRRNPTTSERDRRFWPGLRRDFARTSPGLRQDFARTSPGLRLDFWPGLALLVRPGLVAVHTQYRRHELRALGDPRWDSESLPLGPAQRSDPYTRTGMVQHGSYYRQGGTQRSPDSHHLHLLPGVRAHVREAERGKGGSISKECLAILEQTTEYTIKCGSCKTAYVDKKAFQAHIRGIHKVRNQSLLAHPVRRGQGGRQGRVLPTTPRPGEQADENKDLP
jgi:hypothetical protein